MNEAAAVPQRGADGRRPSPAGLPASPIAGWTWQPVCEATELVEGGLGQRFAWQGARGPQPAFAVRFDGQVRAYLNRCAHVPVELDWDPGRFFDDTALYLVCATHGALYDAATGACEGGPCRNQSLIALDAIEHDAWIWILMQGEAQ